MSPHPVDDGRRIPLVIGQTPSTTHRPRVILRRRGLVVKGHAFEGHAFEQSHDWMKVAA